MTKKLKLNVPINPEVKKLWVEALRSGKYQQGKHKLKIIFPGSICHCCLGVLCELYKEQFPDNSNWIGSTFVVNKEAESAFNLLYPIEQWAGITAPGVILDDEFRTFTEMNDGLNKTFKEIADIIEKHL